MSRRRASRLLAGAFAAAWLLEAYLLIAAWWYVTPPSLITASLGAFLALTQACRWLDVVAALPPVRRWERTR